MNSATSAEILPRHYQEEVFRHAQQENIIAALDTGAGKTFISLLLMKWVTLTRSDAKTIFFVPKVALVEQQGQFIASHSTLRVGKLHGMIEIDVADRKKWNSVFERHDVLVMTPQIFLNLITHSLWGIDRVSLMIFDECHHTRKNHPYSVVMREYFEMSPTSRPKIFGMTASPIWNMKDVAGSLVALEASLDSKIMAVRDHVDELSMHTPKAVEVIKQYPAPPVEYTFPSPTLQRSLSVFKTTFCDLNIPWDDIERRYATTYSDLGPHGASLYLYLEVTHRFSDEVEPQIDFEQAEAAQIQEILAAYQHLTGSQPVCLGWCSPKVGALVEVLLGYGSPTFQGIIFVEQRQIAVCLAKILPRIPVLKDTIRCAELVGERDGRDWISRNHGNNAQSTVQAFREGHINLVIATAVAEEGLDFPACDLVIRFDAVAHMIAYVQSRGRARSKASTFVIMVEENNAAHFARYQAFADKEPELKAIYQARQDFILPDSADSVEEEEEIHASDLAQRERYVVASTGATLTYDNALTLLNRLCALIPHDRYTAPPVPKCSGELRATVQLPTTLPLPRQHLRFEGPLKRSKREAKRAAAFMAVKRLHELDVFDQYLLPVSRASKGHEDNDGVPLLDVSDVPSIMHVSVENPWTTSYSDELWVHSIFIDGRRVAGLVTGTSLFPVELRCGPALVQTIRDERGKFCFSREERELVHRFTKECVFHRVTRSPLEHPLTLYVVPILETAGGPDFPAIRRALSEPGGHSSWEGIDETHYGRLMVRNINLTGHVYLLQRIRHDVSPASVPTADSDGDPQEAAGFATYREYWVNLWTGQPGSRKRPPPIPESGPLLELTPFPLLNVDGTLPDPGAPPVAHVLFPQGCCRWIEISEDVREALHALPALYHKITAVYRARRARQVLSLPPILDDVLVEALTLPCAFAGYSNQRLETLGDAVLQVCTSVHLFNRYPNRHEGQLSILRQNCVSNRFLLSRAKQIGLEAFLICETRDIKTWKANIQCAGLEEGITSPRYVSRTFPRRSLQDCMEAILGASFVTGGIEMALHTGGALGLDFGGPLPWCVRYRFPEASPVSPAFSALQEQLGYSFRCGNLLVEALTHASFNNQATNSYEVLEWLGDAVLSLVVINYMYRKFPAATSDQLAWPRTRAVCAAALAAVAVKRLQLHQLILTNSVELSMEIETYVPLLEACSGEEIVQCGWRYDPPKPLSDIFESVIGAVLVDSNYNYERTAAVVEFVMQDVLEALHPSLRRDPITELLEWASSIGCKSEKMIVFKKSVGERGSHGVAVIVHGVPIVGPIFSASALVAKNLAAEKAWGELKDGNKLADVCDCRAHK